MNTQQYIAPDALFQQKQGFTTNDFYISSLSKVHVEIAREKVPTARAL